MCYLKGSEGSAHQFSQTRVLTQPLNFTQNLKDVMVLYDRRSCLFSWISIHPFFFGPFIPFSVVWDNLWPGGSSSHQQVLQSNGPERSFVNAHHHRCSQQEGNTVHMSVSTSEQRSFSSLFLFL